jgi:hypothetical protein
MVNRTPADVSDSVGAQTILTATCHRRPWLKHLFMDADHARTKLMGKAAFPELVVTIVRRSEDRAGLRVLLRHRGW